MVLLWKMGSSQFPKAELNPEQSQWLEPKQKSSLGCSVWWDSKRKHFWHILTIQNSGIYYNVFTQQRVCLDHTHSLCDPALPSLLSFLLQIHMWEQTTVLYMTDWLISLSLVTSNSIHSPESCIVLSSLGKNKTPLPVYATRPRSVYLSVCS